MCGIEKSDLESRRVERDGKIYYRFTLSKFQTIFSYMYLWEKYEKLGRSLQSYTKKRPQEKTGRVIRIGDNLTPLRGIGKVAKLLRGLIKLMLDYSI